MVAKIKIGKSIGGILHYNENKVIEGVAKLILASGFAGEVENMDFEHKLKRFEHLTTLKPSIKTNALHISLNFHSSENIDDTKMQDIAIAYMESIGFGDQPFLVYRHNDAAHPHIHIATTSIQRNGEPIKTHNIGRLVSEPARKKIEKDFDLVIAENKMFSPEPSIKPIDQSIITYGRLPTKKSINNVLSTVIGSYKYTSLAELNAVLKQFNVVADRGGEETEMYKKKGLIYSIIDEHGKKIGIPIKSSSFYSKPTLQNLEKRYEKNSELRKPLKHDLLKRINKVLESYQSITKNTLIIELKKVGVNLILRTNEQGRIYGTTFVDHINKTVFNGSDLGKLYSANILSQLISTNDTIKTYLVPLNRQNGYLKSNTDQQFKARLFPIQTTTISIGDIFGKPEIDYNPMPNKRKKRKRGLTR
ncbi:relaxase [Pedobacter sp. PACM 27299]|uniref:relaxase/mobilization nuclease domain-containing protein n=1 Tax=Pedobacter sp. PACM 27299 TaxID=1727164 RepID=UPI0007066C1D|nr:relaxase/mobilization nuclease domain-containing protein [Pedobacter sp. PACM 27299]ALL06290.1 relaxase [Pedobacter sp. PACM 27299]